MCKKAVRKLRHSARSFCTMARRFGYSRVSTSDQDWPLQLEALTQAGVDDRDIFRETASGANRDRTELRRMLDQLRSGDQATVYRLDRLARSQLYLLQIMEEIEGKGAKLVSLMDNIDTGTHGGLRDRALIGLMVCTFARIGAATALR